MEAKLCARHRFALPNIQHVGSLVKVAESAVKLLIQKKRQEDDQGNTQEDKKETNQEDTQE